ncbi:FUSC family protein, partial [Pseudomonas aeruginosa]
RMSLCKSVISKRVSDLERRLGVRLLNRTTRNVEPTEAGHFFYKAAKASLQELDNAAEIVGLREDDLCGELRIVTPMSFGTLWLSPIIADFMSQHPRLEIVLQMDDRLTDFEKEGYDLSIRVTRLDDSSLIAQQPLPFFVALGLWLALCTAGGTLLRYTDSHAFVLSGFTAVIVAVLSIPDPENTFMLAVVRVTETLLGVA